MLGPAACRGSYGSAPSGAVRRQALAGASRLACGQAPCSLHVMWAPSETVGVWLVLTPILKDDALSHGLARQVDPGLALAVPTDGDS